MVDINSNDYDYYKLGICSPLNLLVTNNINKFLLSEAGSFDIISGSE